MGSLLLNNFLKETYSSRKLKIEEKIEKFLNKKVELGNYLGIRFLGVSLANTKIFDESHTFALNQVLQGKRYSLLVLDKDQMMTNGLFKTIRDLSIDEDQKLIIYVQGINPEHEFIHLLSSLHEVDCIILQNCLNI